MVFPRILMSSVSCAGRARPGRRVQRLMRGGYPGEARCASAGWTMAVRAVPDGRAGGRYSLVKLSLRRD